MCSSDLSAEKGLFSYHEVEKRLKKPLEKSSLVSLLAMSLALYMFLHLRFSWADDVYKSFSAGAKREFVHFLKRLKNGASLDVGGCAMSSDRLKTVFRNYFSQSQGRLSELLLVKDELSLEYSLSQVFSPKQKELFLKKLKREKLTKTEKEYFSRVVKKKVLALANQELHRLSQRLLE